MPLFVLWIGLMFEFILSETFFVLGIGLRFEFILLSFQSLGY